MATCRAFLSRHRAASRARLGVLLFAFLLAVVTYLDRVCISAAAPFISDDLHLTTIQMGQVLSAFALAYSLFEIPSGWLVDVIGPRRVLTRIVLWWSAFTMLTGAAVGYRRSSPRRFLFGAGEAGAFPSMSRGLSRWFPLSERGKANGVMFFGSRVGGMLSVPIALLLINRWGWRLSFVIVGAIGLVWAAAWFALVSRSSVRASRRVSPSELAWIEQDWQVRQVGRSRAMSSTRTPWRALLRSRNLYAICAMYFTYGYGLYFYFTWLPTYLIRVLGFSALNGGLLAGLPFLCAGLANLAGGWLTDVLARDRGLRVARCGLGCGSFLTGGRAHVRVHARPAADRESRAAGAGAGIRRSRAQRLLGRVPRHRPRSRRRRDRLHEHVLEPWRRADAARRRVCGRSLAVVDVSVLRHGGGVRGGRADLAGDRS